MITEFKDLLNVLNEGFIIKDNIVYFDPSNDKYVKTSFGKSKSKKPYKKKLANGYAYSVYIKSDITDDDYTEVLRALKKQSSKYTIDHNSYRKFIQRTAMFLAPMIIHNDTDTIIIMQSSSNLVVDLSLELNRRLPKYYTMFSYENAIFKELDYSKIMLDKKNNMSDKTYNSLLNILNKQKESNYFSISKFPGQFRNIIKNWLKMDGNILTHIVDKNVVILDDILTTGSTLNEASILLGNAGAKSVMGLTILKGKH